MVLAIALWVMCLWVNVRVLKLYSFSRGSRNTCDYIKYELDSLRTRQTSTPLAWTGFLSPVQWTPTSEIYEIPGKVQLVGVVKKRRRNDPKLELPRFLHGAVQFELCAHALGP